MTEKPATRTIARDVIRVWPIGVKDGPAVLIALCNDGSLWELNRQRDPIAWSQLPVIPGTVPARAAPFPG